MICFRKQQYELNKVWYDSREKDQKEKLYRHLTAFGVILKSENRSFVCETEHYPSCTAMFYNVNESIPKTLLFLIKQIIMKDKKGDLKP